MATIEKIQSLYDVLNYRNAIGVLEAGSKDDFRQLLSALAAFRFSREDILSGGGNESNIPKKFSALLHPIGWRETQISGDLLVRLKAKKVDETGFDESQKTIEQFLDGHKIDYVKNRVACDLEWNSKDQTFDRDLYAFGAFYQANIIDAAVLVTRSEKMNALFKDLGISKKYGASTTWMGKLSYRIHANRSGGCPVLALGITPELMEG